MHKQRLDLFRNALRKSFVLCLAIFLSACSPDQDAELTLVQKKDATHPELRLSIDLWPGYYPAVIAKQKGWFEEAGLRLVLDMPGDTDKMLAHFSAGTIDAIAVAFGDAILVSRQMPDVAVILVTDESAGGDAVLSKDPNVLENLAGKKIGTNLGGFGELLIRKMLDQQNLNVTHVNMINVDASKVPELLASGLLDVGHTWQPYVSQAEKVGASVVFSSANTPGLIPDTVAISGEFKQKHPEAVRTFLQVWFKAQRWWLNNQSQGNQIIAQATSQKIGDISLEGIRLMNQSENIQTFNDTEGESGLPNALKLYNDFYVNLGVLRSPASDSILASEFLK